MTDIHSRQAGKSGDNRRAGYIGVVGETRSTTSTPGRSRSASIPQFKLGYDPGPEITWEPWTTETGANEEEAYGSDYAYGQGAGYAGYGNACTWEFTDLPSEIGYEVYALWDPTADPPNTTNWNAAALMRGDNTSAWYEATPNTGSLSASVQDVEDVPNQDMTDWTYVNNSDSSYGSDINHDYYVIDTESTEKTIEWKLGAASDRVYQLFATWVPGAHRVDTATYTVTGADRLRRTTTDNAIVVNQQFTPGEFAVTYTAGNDVPWRSLGYFIATGTEITVELKSSADAEWSRTPWPIALIVEVRRAGDRAHSMPPSELVSKNRAFANPVIIGFSSDYCVFLRRHTTDCPFG